MAICVMLVLLASINLSSLVTTQVIQRKQEWSTRLALGARRFHLILSVFTETTTIVIASAVIALWLGMFFALLLQQRGFIDTFSSRPTITLPLLIFVAVCSVMASLIASLWPALRGFSQSASIRPSLVGTSLTLSRARDRFAVVAIEVAVALALTATGFLVVGSYVSASDQLGFDSNRLLIVSGRVDEAASSAAQTFSAALTVQRTAHPRRAALTDQLIAAVKAVPGVTTAAVTDAPILIGRRPGGISDADTYAISEEFIETLRLQLLAGRWPTLEEVRGGHPVAVVTPNVIKNGSKLGSVIRGAFEPLTVVGIVQPARLMAWDWNGDVSKQVYVPYVDQSMRPTFTLVVKVSPSADLEATRSYITKMGIPGVRFGASLVADSVLVETARERQFESLVFSIFSVCAMAVVAMGIGGLVAVATAQRRREIGVRVATGASRATVVRLLVREQTSAVLAGLAVGLLFALAALPLIAPFIYGSAPLNPIVWAMAAAVILCVTTTSVLVPAYRFSGTDPVLALKVD
jgi:ABC-type antimicrobial peptide transport system permease subunit